MSEEDKLTLLRFRSLQISQTRDGLNYKTVINSILNEII